MSTDDGARRQPGIDENGAAEPAEAGTEGLAALRPRRARMLLVGAAIVAAGLGLIFAVFQAISAGFDKAASEAAGMMVPGANEARGEGTEPGGTRHGTRKGDKREKAGATGHEEGAAENPPLRVPGL